MHAIINWASILFVANETGERKRELVEAAGCRAVRSLMAMQKKSQIFQLDFRVIRFRQRYFLAILGCSWMLSIYRTNQSEHYLSL